MNRTEVVVGVDGSAPSRTALRWAAAEAARREATLRVLHAYDPRWPDSLVPVGETAERTARERAEEILSAMVSDAHAYAPEINVTGNCVIGGPAQVLLDAARGAALVVVGSRGHSGFGAALVGSTSQQVAMHAVVPVAVVRGRGDSAIGPVVVGQDGSPSSEHTLALAFEQAQRRGCGLIATRAFHTEAPTWPATLTPPVHNPAQARATLEAELHRALAPWAAKYPDVVVETLVAVGDAAHVLMTVSRSAQLVVVGTRGHGGFTGLLLGSVGLHLLHHSDCPVLVVRKEPFSKRDLVAL